MLDELLSYDPDALSVKKREQMAKILLARAEFLRAAADVAELRSRAWTGDKGATELAELKGADLTKLRQDYVEHALVVLQDGVNVEHLQSLLPMVMMAALQSFKTPLPVLLEAVGLDIDYFKLASRGIKEFIEGWNDKS